MENSGSKRAFSSCYHNVAGRDKRNIMIELKKYLISCKTDNKILRLHQTDWQISVKDLDLKD